MREVDQEKGRLRFRLAGDAAHQEQHRDHPWAAAERRDEREDPGGQRSADLGAQSNTPNEVIMWTVVHIIRVRPLIAAMLSSELAAQVFNTRE